MENKIKFNFEYSIDSEVQRVLNTIKKWGWYLEHSYKPRLPKKLDVTKLNDYTVNDIIAIVTEEYSQEFFEQDSFKIGIEWQKYTDFFAKICRLGLSVGREYKIFLTKYGTDGSYKLPNKIVLSAEKDESIPVLVHEIIHLAIENLISEFKIEQFVKERIVDLILARIYPKIGKMQNLLSKEINNKIDAIFNMYYPNIREVIRLVSELKDNNVSNKAKTKTEEKRMHYRNYINR